MNGAFIRRYFDLNRHNINPTNRLILATLQSSQNAFLEPYAESRFQGRLSGKNKVFMTV